LLNAKNKIEFHLRFKFSAR